MNDPHSELLALARAFIGEAAGIVKEQERLIDHLDDSPIDSRLKRILLATVVTAGAAIAEQETLTLES